MNLQTQTHTFTAKKHHGRLEIQPGTLQKNTHPFTSFFWSRVPNDSYKVGPAKTSDFSRVKETHVTRLNNPDRLPGLLPGFVGYLGNPLRFEILLCFVCFFLCFFYELIVLIFFVGLFLVLVLFLLVVVVVVVIIVIVVVVVALVLVVVVVVAVAVAVALASSRSRSRSSSRSSWSCYCYCSCSCVCFFFLLLLLFFLNALEEPLQKRPFLCRRLGLRRQGRCGQLLS